MRNPDRAAPRGGPRASAPLAVLRPIRTVQLYEQIGEQLIAQIRMGHWRPGDRLPPERELALSLEVSRPSLREALAALQLRGVLETRQGSGSVVSDGALEQVTRANGPEPIEADVGPVALLEAREAFEPQIVAIAAGRRASVAPLEAFLGLMRRYDDLSDPAARTRWCDADRLFHREIAVMTGNPVLTLVADYIADVMDQPLWRRLRDEMLSLPGRLEASAREHERIVDALNSGDASVASRHARHHVREVRTEMKLR